MNIATINDTLLPVVLFVIYFVFVSVVRYNLKDKANVSTNKEVTKTSEEQPKSFTYRDAFSAEFDPDPKRAIASGSAPSAIAKEIVVSVELENKEEVETPISPQVLTDDEFIDAPTTTHQNHQSIPEIIDGLGKRDIRKLCAPLGIKQKTNGTELTTELMKALVKRKFKENPQMVVEVIGDRFPSLMSTLSEPNQQQTLEKKAC
jgi:hypothetical protein